MPPEGAPGEVVWRFDVFEVDVAAAELRKAGRRVKLQDQPWQVLVALVENAGRTVTREELRARLWPDDTFVDFDHGLNVAISKIRDALGDAAGQPRFVETVPRRGYRFIGSLERIASPPSTPADGSDRRARWTPAWTRRTGLIAGAGGLAVLVIAGFAARARWWEKPSAHVIAVLPLRNLSPEAGTDYFTDGLTDEIINNLSAIEGLEVRSRSSSFHFKGKDVSASDAGEQLRADLVLEGTLLLAGKRLRLSIDLVRAADDKMLWSARYDREIAGVFEIQDEISRAIVNELRLKGIGGRRRYNTSGEAYDLYLRAITLSNDSSPGLARDQKLSRAIELFHEVTARDRQFAPAYAGAAEAWANLRNRGRSRESTERMREAAEQAIDIDPLLPDARATLGLVHASDLQWQNAETDFQRALELNPNAARTHADFARFVLLPEERTQEAEAELQKALDLDPLTTSRRIELAYARLREGAYDKTLALTAPIYAADPSDHVAGQLTGRALWLQGNRDQGLAILEKLPKESGSHQYLGYAYAIMGRRREAQALADEPDPAAARHQLVIDTALGDRDHAFAALHAMVEASDWAADWYPGDPELRSLRDDPRMREFRRQRGLPVDPPRIAGSTGSVAH
jgi:TolB-like protein/DNA-binding winged helix-turn-helix (wHTH) protein/Flp pilus assembly protein TadD